ncbi:MULTISPECIES: hypothetical protein [Streptomyces]|uniref:Uncharacterized protein n=1 Tax=Streptomyces canarius TaxID=285453 RepID=A0ABQ3DAS5_9ACTN|nr:hypothetical protein [Streptomyces canarius]GHA65811.1 hypothetical protein GCM10010345_82120 [Streptomyces canarius]
MLPLPKKQLRQRLLPGVLGANPDLTVNVLANRPQRTAVQVPEPGSEELPPGREAAFAAVMTAVYALGAQLHADRGDEEGTRHALSGADEALIDILRGMHDLRVAIGDGAGWRTPRTVSAGIRM